MVPPHVNALQPVIINLAPTGIVPTRAQSPHVPLQPEEIVRDVLACAEVGITIVHLHARDLDGRHTYSKSVFARMIGAIRDRRPDLILCVTCSGRSGLSIEERAEVLELTGDLKPDLASLTLSSLNFASTASLNAPDIVIALAERMRDRGIRPELEVFDIGMGNMMSALLRRRLIEPPLYANLLFGNIASAQARFIDIGAVITSLPSADVVYGLAGIGPAQLPVAALAVAMAPAVRIGLEDNLWLDFERQKLATNKALVERVHALASAIGRPVMTATEARIRLGLDQPRRGGANI
jgi:3-keto-5-aminohexanoate cleavage enzyme